MSAVPKKTASSGSIAAQITALDTTLFGWEKEAADISLDAVNGDADAAKRLAELNRQIEGARADRQVLERAQKTAFKREQAARETAQVEQRAKHLNAARKHAEALRAAAAKADQMITELRSALVEMDTHERAIRAELHRAGVTPPGAIRYRQGLAGHVLAVLKAMHDTPTGYLEDRRGAAKLASVAWAFLLETEAGEAA